MMGSTKPLWVKLAMCYYDDAKFNTVSPLAELLYVRSVSFAKVDNTGFVSVKPMLRVASDLADDFNVLADQLVDAGLWVKSDDGFEIANWSDWQESADKVDARREAGRVAAQRRHGSPNGLPNGLPSGSALGTPMQEKSKSKSRDISIAHSDEFTEFWSVYPRKVARADAVKAWKATTSVRPELSVLVAAVEAAKAGWVDPKFIPYPASWLRAHRWADAAGMPSEALRAVLSPCRGCIGTGRQDYGNDAGKEPCRDCGGSGKVEK
jgi:hypothetical protein